MDGNYFIVLEVFNVIFILLMFVNKHPVLALFPLMGAFVGATTTLALGSDPNGIAFAYSGTTPINWSNYPLIIVPLSLTLISVVFALMRMFKIRGM
jgi:hypothetical protein